MGHTVFIIGNGFDLSLGLKTSYRDFMSSIFYNEQLNFGNELFEHLKNQTSIENWIDIEKELAKFSQKKNGSYCLLQDYHLLCETLKKYLSSLNIESINQGSQAYKVLTNSFDENTIILNFNYTDSVIYSLEKANFSSELISRNVIYVHGSVSENNIIFGVDDSSRIYKNDTFLYKSTSSHYDGRIVKKHLEDFSSLKIFGHSLGESDHMYFKKIVSQLSYMGSTNKTMTLYYYEDEGKFQLYKQLHDLTSNSVADLKNNIHFEEFDVSVL